MDTQEKKPIYKKWWFWVLAVLFVPCSVRGQNPYEVTSSQPTSKDSIPDTRSNFAKQFPYIPMSEWHKGMRFMVGPDNNGDDLDLIPYAPNTPEISENSTSSIPLTITSISSPPRGNNSVVIENVQPYPAKADIAARMNALKANGINVLAEGSNFVKFQSGDFIDVYYLDPQGSNTLLSDSSKDDQATKDALQMLAEKVEGDAAKVNEVIRARKDSIAMADELRRMTKLKVKDFEYKTFVVDTIEKRSDGTFVVFSSDGGRFEHQVSEVSTNIDHLVYLADIDSAKPSLVGKMLYVLTSEWLRNGMVTNETEQYVPVQVTKVGMGTSDNPVRIVFKPEGQDEAYLDVSLSGVNKSSYGDILGKPFDEAFSFSDPKLAWKGIRKKYWNTIEHGQVKAGMSEDECTLSWGAPKDVNTSNSGRHVDEQWVYGESSYLYFTDGILTTIQN